MEEDEFIAFLDFVKESSYLSFGDAKPTILTQAEVLLILS